LEIQEEGGLVIQKIRDAREWGLGKDPGEFLLRIEETRG
jgi:hypothetical protein